MIRKLEQFDQSLLVVAAQETGFRFVIDEDIKKVHITLDVYKDGFVGPHTEDDDDFFTDYEHAEVVALSPT